MRYLISLLCVALTTVLTSANHPENWVSARLVCQSSAGYEIEVSAYGSVNYVMITPSREDGIEWIVDSVAKRFTVSLENETIFLIAYTSEGGVLNGDSLILSETMACGAVEPAIDIRAFVLSISHESGE
jgi:hypothetical protein